MSNKNLKKSSNEQEDGDMPKVVARSSRDGFGRHQFVRSEGSRSCSTASTNRSLDVVGEDECDLDIGTEPTAHNLYEGAKDEEGYTTWLDEIPKDIAAVTARKVLHKTHALLLRHVKQSDAAGDKAYTLDSLVIQSPLLQDVLCKVLDKYPGINVYSREPTFHPPFAPFFHCWNEFEQALETSKNDETLHAHLKLLHSILDAELSPIRHEARRLIKHGVITSDLLWTLYPPGSGVFGKLRDQDHAFIVRSTHDRSPELHITLNGVDYDGFDFGFKMEHSYLSYFKGEKNINELDVVPWAHHVNRDSLTARLHKRGLKFMDLINAGYRSYVGFCFPGRVGKGQFIDGRIMVDSAGYMSQYPEPRSLRPLAGCETDYLDDDVFGTPMSASIPYVQIPDSMAYEEYSNIPPDEGSNFPTKKTKKKTKSKQTNSSTGLPTQRIHRNHKKNKASASKLSTEQIIMCSSMVRGFCLTTKQWAEFNVDDVNEIDFNSDAFSKLVMSPSRKRLIRALVQEQAGQRTHFDDIIQGKGLGLIMLLSGPPGTGKTLTAESISDALKLPLYVLTASELLDDVDEIEERLQGVFQLAAKWNAVVLLDEADAFLEKRTHETNPENRERNKRVAAFLRLLEYFKGTLILTTNRPITFDEAFYSRIHLTLRFQPLDVQARRSIWSEFLNTDEYRPSPRQLDVLARIDMNGREIKNVVKMARLLAKHQEEPIGFEHVNDVLDVVETPNEGEVGEAL